jgi:hypothetical protein
MEPGPQPAEPDVEKDAGADDAPEDSGFTTSMETLDRLIAMTSRAATAYLVLAVAVGLVSIGLLLGLVLIPQLEVAGVIGSAATATMTLASVALIVAERTCVGALETGKQRMLRDSSKPADPRKSTTPPPKTREVKP